MKIISLASYYAGPACAIADFIKKYFYDNSKQTNFFDYLVISMKSINEILEGKTIDLDLESAVINPLNTITISFKDFDLLVSNHDIKEFPITPEINNEVIEKYNRRYDRLINDFKNEDIIYFLRYIDDIDFLKEVDITKFFNNIKTINSNLIVYLIILTDKDNVKLPENLITNDNIILFNFNIYNDTSKIYNTDIYYRILDDYDYFNLKNLIYN